MRVVTVSRKNCASASTTENVVTFQAGSLNIDKTRIGFGQGGNREGEESRERRYTDRGNTNFAPTPGPRGGDARGRWPANVIFQHRSRCACVGTRHAPGYTINRWTDGAKPFGGGAGHAYESSKHGEVQVPVWSCEEGCSVLCLESQSGVTTNTSHYSYKRSGGDFIDGIPSAPENRHWKSETGTAARYFKQVQSEDNMAQIPQELWDYLTTLIAPPPSCDPVIIASSDLNSVDFSSFEDSTVHGMIIVGDPTLFFDEIDRVLRPGAHLLVISGDDDPTGAVGACAVEDKGYEIRDAIAVLDAAGEFHYVPKAASRERHAGVTPRERVRETSRYFPTEGADLDLLQAELEDCFKPKELVKMTEVGLDPEKVPEDALPFLELRTMTTRRVVRSDHPTVKPIKVMERLLEDVPKDALVLDTFMGSGTTGISCLRTGHDFIGIEQDSGYIQIADERIRHWDRVVCAWEGAKIQSEAPPIEDEAKPDGGVFDMFGGET